MIDHCKCLIAFVRIRLFVLVPSHGRQSGQSLRYRGRAQWASPRRAPWQRDLGPIRDIRTLFRDDRYQIHMASWSLDAAAASLQRAGCVQRGLTFESPVFMSCGRSTDCTVSLYVWNTVQSPLTYLHSEHGGRR